ncbi:MAG TPA: MerR family transcriptional regulator [Ktedonobacteraceae bacterium]
MESQYAIVPKQQSAVTIERENAEAQQHALDDVFTIQQMAQATGLSAHTLRYYERAGLMKHQVGRGETNGYRVYTRQHLDWIEFIKRLRATGMPIRDIQRYTELIHQGEQTAPERLRLLKQHQKRVETHRLEIEQHLVSSPAIKMERSSGSILRL